MKPSPDLAMFCVAAYAAATLAAVPPALAQTSTSEQNSVGARSGASGSADDNDAARRLYRDGVAAFEADKPEEARLLLLQAWSIRRTYDVASVLGQVELALNLARDAAEHLDFAVRNFPPQLSAEALQRVRDTFSQAEKRVATLIVNVDRPGARVLVDAKLAGTTPLASPLFLEPGSHTIESEEGGSRASREILLEAGTTQALGLDLGPSRPAPPPRVSAVGSNVKPVPLIVGGTLVLVGATLGVGFAMAAAADRDRGDALRAQLTGGSCYAGARSDACSALRRASEDHDRDRNIATVGFAVAGTALIATVTYWALSRARATQPAGGAASVRLGASATKQQSALWLSGAF